MGELFSDLICRAVFGVLVGAIVALAMGCGGLVFCGIGAAGSLSAFLEGRQ